MTGRDSSISLNRARALLEQAWEQPAADRLDWLAAHCDDPELRAEVESLLHADREATDFLAGDAGTLAARLLETAGRPAAAVQQRIDRYEIVKRIARGGMGDVYLAERADATFEQVVALKLAHRGYVMEVGNIVLEDAAANLLSNPEVQNAYLGGTH